ncbi:MAG: ATP-binding protein [Colwellia sp.]|nr:ATP-binding protein [Colwellia sp.]
MTGQVAYGKNYFPREKDEKRIWRRLNHGSHLLLLAPRRVGKTSLLRNLELAPNDNYVFLYNIVQSCSTVHEYYERIIENLLVSEFTNRLKKFTKWTEKALTDFRASIKGINFSEAGIEFESQERTLTHKDLKTLLDKIQIKEKLIIVIDEFPDVLEKIHRDQGHSAAELFLSGCRELCQDPALDQKIQFIFTGSIGLDSLVNKLNLSDLINFLINVTIDPLTEEKAFEFIYFVSKKSDDGIVFNEEVKTYILNKVSWHMPYYIEILLLSIEDYCCDNDIIEPKSSDIDKAFEQLFSQNYLTSFNHWAERLERLEKTEITFAHDVLNYIAANGTISPQIIHNIKEAPQVTSVNSKYVIECLIHDGYIFETENKEFQFTSPMLKEWWGRYANK